MQYPVYSDTGYCYLTAQFSTHSGIWALRWIHHGFFHLLTLLSSIKNCSGQDQPAVHMIGAFVMSPRFTSCPPAYHTHLAGLARIVSLHRTSSHAADSPTRWAARTKR